MHTRSIAPLVSLLLLATPVSATTWGADVVECPVCGAENLFQGISSHGSYIYRWPSKCQYVYWPFTDARSVYSCSRCRYSTFLDDFKAIPADKVDAVRKSLEDVKLPVASEYWNIPTTARLEVAGKVYQAIGQDDLKWSHFYRVLAYHYEEDGETAKAAAARRKAIEAAERAAASPEHAGREKELLVITGAMRMFLGESELAAGDLDGAGKSKTVDAANPDDAAGFDRYLDELLVDLKAGLSRGEKTDGSCAPTCSPDCWRRPPLATWQRLERALLKKGVEELEMERQRACLDAPAAGPRGICAPRHESTPALKWSPRPITIAEVLDSYGPATSVEAVEGGKGKRFFWGPIYLVARDEKSAPEAQGLDAILLSVTRDAEARVNGATYVRQASSESAAMEVTGTPVGARIVLADEGAKPKESKLPGRIEGLEARRYRLLVEAPGHRSFEAELFAEPGFVARFDVRLDPHLPWEAVIADHFALSLEALQRRAFDEAECFDDGRFETAPILREGAATRVSELIARHGPARVEEGRWEKRPAKRFFWGPAFVVATGEDAVPVAGGVDFLLDRLMRGARACGVSTVRYTANGSAGGVPATGGLEVTCKTPGGKVSVIGPTGKRLAGKAPWKNAALPPGEYEVQVTRAGHSKYQARVLVEPGFDAVVEAYLFSRDD